MVVSRLKVLVVDDQRPVVNALRVLFDVHGIDCLSAVAPAEALEVVRREPVGVVIQDMNFGSDRTSGEEGIRLFHDIREIEPGLPVVLMTAWASLETAVQLIKEGANDYLAKPWDDDKLLLTVKNLLEMRRLQLENLRLQRERREAREALEERYELCGIVYDSAEMQRLVTLAGHVAGSDAPVLITGPSGAGKEKLAEIVQANSRRRSGEFVRVNVGALPEELMESELFGAEAGAYTGSTGLRIGRFEAADGGTIFLDEIDALSLTGQVKLLRVVQSGEFQRLGSSKTRHADVRIISATNSDLKAAIAAGRFREDLFFRLNVIELALPPLERRPEDILPLAHYFLGEQVGDNGETPELSEEAQRALLEHRWEGNVRELRNRIHRATLIRRGAMITAADLDLGAPVGAPGDALRAAEPIGAETYERRKIERALVEADGVISRAAQELGLSRQALYRRMERLGIVLERRPRH
jgi:DNA-binding NtrC family response regulator